MNHEAITKMTDEILDDRHEYPNIIRRMLDDNDGMESFYELVHAYQIMCSETVGPVTRSEAENAFVNAAEMVCEDLRGGADELACAYQGRSHTHGPNGRKRGEVA